MRPGGYRVRPELLDEQHLAYDEPHYIYDEEPTSCVAWVKARWWAKALLVVLAAGIVVALVVGPVCGIRGCPPKQHTEQDDAGLLRLIVQFVDIDKDAMDVIPALLRQFTTRIKLDSSMLQILDFVDEDVLQAAKRYLEAENVTLLLRDFVMRTSPKDVGNLLVDTDRAKLDTLLSNSKAGVDMDNIINGIAPQQGSGRRRLLQQAPVNDPLIANGSQWHHARIRSRSAWTVTKGSSPVIVAVIDSGFDLSHPDLAGRLWVNKREIAGNKVDDDKNNYVDDINGYAFVGACVAGQKNSATTTCQCTGTNDLSPSDNHGTHVAGLVAAALNNLMGGAGSAPNVQLMLLKVSDCTFDAGIAAATVITALDYAYKMGAHIVTMSLGSEFNYNMGGGQPISPAPADGRYQKQLQAYITAIKPLEAKGTLVMSAAGNENLDLNDLARLQFTYTPCMVASQLSNTMCIGASDISDNRAFFSNWGSYVTLSAPGTSIVSTFPGGKPTGAYGIFDGTSQATPIVAGVAALVASILGMQDGNYYKAAMIRRILVDSGDFIPSLKGWTGSSKRVNSYNAVQLALDAITVNSVTVPPLGPTTTQASTTMFNGFTESYWPNANTLVLDSAGLTQLDQSVRGGGPTFSNFKYTSGVMVNMSALLRLNVSGLHTFTLRYSTTYLGARIWVNNVKLSLVTNANSATASFKASGPGFYSVAFVLVPAPGITVSVTLLPPGAAAAALFSGSYLTSTSATFTPPVVTNNYTDPTNTGVWGFNSGWFVFFNRISSVGLNVNSIFKFIKINSQWDAQWQVDDLDSIAINFRSMLGSSGSTALIGYATSIWDVRDVPSQIFFNTTCKSACAVYLNGQLVVENWSAYASNGPLSKSSSCITINPSLGRYRIDVMFVASGSPVFFIGYKACNGGLQNVIDSASLSPAVIDYAAGGQAQTYIGWIGGVQCDVWRSTANATSIPTMPPTYKFRLPNCPSPELISSSCLTSWIFNLNSTVPGLASFPNGVFAVRCWTYTNVTLPTTLTASPSTLTTAVHVAGIPRYRATASGVTLRLPMPKEIRYGSTHHQIVVEWLGASSTQLLSLLGNGSPIPINFKAFRLPLWTTTDPLDSVNPKDPNLNMKVIGSPGIYIQGFLATFLDVPTAVAYTLPQVAIPSGAMSSSASALGTSYSLPTSATLMTKTWYAVTEGYYFTLDISNAFNSFIFDQKAGTAVQVVVGDVVIWNADPLSTTSPAQISQSVQVYIPSGYLRMRIITKIMNQASVTYNWKVKPSVGDIQPMNNAKSYFTWMRATWQPQTP